MLVVLGNRHGDELGANAAIVGSGALAWAIAFSRIRRGPFARPPLLSVIGVAVFALALLATLRPDILYMPQWIAQQRVEQIGADRFGRGDRVLGDEREADVAAVIHAHPRYRRAFAELLGVERIDGCDVDVILPDDAEDYADLARAAGVEGDGATMGFAYAPPLGRRVVVHHAGSGWGSITHHLALHMVACELPRAPPWLANGVAALVENHRLGENDHFELRFRSDWRVPESTLRSPPRDLNIELFRGDDQGFLRAFFLYLNERNQLRPLLVRVRAGEDALAALAAVTGKGPSALEQDWRTWLENEAHDIPHLDTATPAATAPPI